MFASFCQSLCIIILFSPPLPTSCSHFFSLAPIIYCCQATEAICDTALKWGKPFSIVPCCVFSREFPNRVRVARVAAGEGVGQSLASQLLPVATSVFHPPSLEGSCTGNPLVSAGPEASALSNTVADTEAREHHLQSGNLETPNQRITSYADFILFLTEKDSRVRQAKLNIEGKNLVLYIPIRD